MRNGSMGRRFCAIVIGLVFFVAGLLKVQDPVGAGLVVKEYFNFFHVGFLEGISKPAGALMALVETVCGIALISGVARKATALLTMTLTAFFTFITVLLVIFNPVMDCGCFGEAVHLSHAQTLIKNLILCVLCALAFLPLNRLGENRSLVRPAVALVAALSIAGFGVYSWLRIPSVDFMAFKPGVTLRAADDGIDDSMLVDLPVRDAYGDYCDELLCDGNVVLFSVYDNMDTGGWMALSEAVADAMAGDFQCYVLMPDASMAPMDLADIAMSADRKTILTLNRSNGGACWLEDGTVIRKWAFSRLPDAMEWIDLAGADPDTARMDFIRSGRIRFQAFVLYPLLMMVL